MNLTTLSTAVTKTANAVGKFTTKNAPIIFAIKGAIGVLTTAALAVKATPKALKLIEEAESKKMEDSGERLTKAEIVKSCWKCYVPSAIEGALSIAAICGGTYIYYKRTESLAALALASEKTLKETMDKVKKAFGEEAASTIKDQLNQDKIDEIPVPEKHKEMFKSKSTTLPSVDDMMGQDNILCFEPYSNHYFVSSRKALEYFEAHIQKMHIQHGADYLPTTVNDFLFELDDDLEPIDYIGECCVWEYDKTPVLELKYTPMLTKDQIPCLRVEVREEPAFEW